jgi:hypothetical protein
MKPYIVICRNDTCTDKSSLANHSYVVVNGVSEHDAIVAARTSRPECADKDIVFVIELMEAIAKGFGIWVK